MTTRAWGLHTQSKCKPSGGLSLREDLICSLILAFLSLVLVQKKKLPQGGAYLGSRHSSAPSLASPGLDPTLQHSRDVGPTKVSVNDSPLLHHKRSSAKSTAFPTLSSVSSKI